MTNTILTPQMITRKALMILHQKLTLIGNMNRQYDKQYAQEGGKIGDTLKIRLPNQYTVTSGAALSTQDTTEQSVSLQVNNQKHVDTKFTAAELSLSLDDFADRILEPSMAVLASALEADAATMYGDVYNLVGTPGTVPNTLLGYLLGKAKLDNSLAPPGKRTAHLSPTAGATMVDALKGLFQDSDAISEQYREGKMGRTAGFDWYENTLVPIHTNGSTVTGLTVSGAGQTGSSLLVAGSANTNTFLRGTVFTMAGVFRVHPETKKVLSDLQQFVVTADTTATTTTVTLPISPAIVISGASQNVSAAPGNSAAIVVQSGAATTSYEQEMLFHRDAFAFATADLVMPKGVDFSAREVYDGISMRIVRQYDINSDALPCRIDVLYGFKTIRPQLACRVTS